MSAESLGPEALDQLRRRSERARARSEAAAAHEEAALPVAMFTSGGERYAVPLSALRAAVPVRVVTPLPLAPAHVVGVLRFRGKIITAFSLGALLGVRGWQQDPAVLLVVQQGAAGLAAVDCEQVPTPGSLPLRLVEEARARAGGCPIARITTEAMERVSLLDLPALLAQDAARRAGRPGAGEDGGGSGR